MRTSTRREKEKAHYLLNRLSTKTGEGQVATRDFIVEWSISSTETISGENLPHDTDATAYIRYDLDVKVPVNNVDLKAWSTCVEPQSRYQWDPHAPSFFSGTNCRALASVTSQSGDVAWAKMYINGTLVHEATPSTSTSSLELDVAFDSTHFPNSSQIDIWVEGEDTDGNDLFGDVSGEAQNNALVGYNAFNNPLGISSPFGATCADLVSEHATSMNHHVDFKTPSNGSVAQLLLPLQLSTVCYMVTHGTGGEYNVSASILDCAHDENSTYYIDAIPEAGYSVQTQVAAKSSRTAPYNLVHLDACETQQKNTSFADAFLESTDRTDRALMGWSPFLLVDFNLTRWTDYVWSCLEDGTNLADAITIASAIVTPKVSDYDPPAAYFHTYSGVPTVHGDIAMKLHGVYMGTDASQWFRQRN